MAALGETPSAAPRRSCVTDGPARAHPGRAPAARRDDGGGQDDRRAAWPPSGSGARTSTPTTRSRRRPGRSVARDLRHRRRAGLPGRRGATALAPWPSRGRAGGDLRGRRRRARPGEPVADRARRRRSCGCGPTSATLARAGRRRRTAARCSATTRRRALAELDAVRRPLYAALADAVVDVDDLTPDEVADAVLDARGPPVIVVPVALPGAPLRRAGRARGAPASWPTWSAASAAVRQAAVVTQGRCGGRLAGGARPRGRRRACT